MPGPNPSEQVSVVDPKLAANATPPETDPKAALAAQYADDEPAAPEPAPKPAAKPAEPAKVNHPRRLVQRALELNPNITAEQLASVSTDELDDWVYNSNLRVESELRGQTKAGKEKETPKADDDPLAELEKDLDPRMAKVLRGIVAENKQLKDAVIHTSQREQTRQARQTEEAYDDAFASMGAKYEKLFGKGDGRALPKGGKELKKRVAVLASAGLDLQNDSPAAMKRKIARAVDELYGDVVADPVAQDPDDPYAAVAKAKNGKVEEWQAASLARPTHRKNPSPPGREKAIRTAAAMLKEMGPTPDTPDADDEDEGY